MGFRISLDDVTQNNLGVVEKINEVTLPIKYDHLWYKESLQANEGHLVQIAFFNELPVGAIKARTVTENGRASPSFVYIDTITVLEAYRGFGIATKLLEWLIEETKQRFIHKIQAHVWKNSKSKGWYLKNGFEEKNLVKDYFKAWGLEDPDAIILSLNI